MIVTIPSLLMPDEVEQAQSLLQGAFWSDGRITASAKVALMKNNQRLAEDSLLLPALRTLIMQALARNATFMAAALPVKVLPPTFNRYTGATDAYGPHVDGAIRQAPDGSYVRSDLSTTLFLSNQQSHDGGELTIANTFGTHRIRLPAISLVLYLSSSVHEVTPVTRGERVAYFMFIQRMVRDTAQRRLLCEMDLVLLQPRETVGETEPVLQLTGTYQNLLRQWAGN